MKNIKLNIFVGIFVCIGLLTSCWPSKVSFYDNSMPPEWKTFSVATLKNSAPNAPLSYPANLTENLKDEIQNNTKLQLDAKTGGGEVFIDGTITNYSITPIAIQPGDNAAKNRLTINVSFEIFITLPKEEKYQLNSSRFADYNVSQDISQIESDLLTEINEQITRDVINKLFSNW